jgi:hypothetical protein
MVVILILLALQGAFYLLRMWEAAGEPVEEGPDAAQDREPPSPATRLTVIVCAIVLEFVTLVGVPLALDAVGGDDAEPIGCVTFVDDVVRPGGDPVLQVSFEDCGSR